MTIVGYARVSSTGQTLEVQTDKLAQCERCSRRISPESTRIAQN
jgi:DNA invertase Pin-like site-specific DNA recombinase